MSKKGILIVAKSLLGLTLSLQAGYSSEKSIIENLFSEAELSELGYSFTPQASFSVDSSRVSLFTEADHQQLARKTFETHLEMNKQRLDSQEFNYNYKISLKKGLMDTFIYWGIDKLPSIYALNLEVLKTIRCEDDFGTQAVLDEVVKEISLKKEQLWPQL